MIEYQKRRHSWDSVVRLMDAGSTDQWPCLHRNSYYGTTRRLWIYGEDRLCDILVWMTDVQFTITFDTFHCRNARHTQVPTTKLATKPSENTQTGPNNNKLDNATIIASYRLLFWRRPIIPDSSAAVSHVSCEKCAKNFTIKISKKSITQFLSRVSILTRDTDIANLSVGLSVTFRYQMKTA